jgi:hypothetical protein
MKRKAVVAVATLGLVVFGALPARAALFRIVIQDSEGAMTLPGQNGSNPGCGIKSSGGGCSTAQSGFYLQSGPAFLQPCAAVLYTTDVNFSAGTCQIDNNNSSSPSAGTGSVTVDDSSGCSSFTVDYVTGDPPASGQQVWFQDGGGRTWRVTQFHLKAVNGAPQGLGYAWTIAGRRDGVTPPIYDSWMDIKDFSNGDTFRLLIVKGGLAAAVACNSTNPVTGFTFKLEADTQSV